MPTTMANEKWILTVKEMHLGHCKETFRAGAVIELDEVNGRLIIDGRRFNDTRDLDILKRRTQTNPDNPWILPYSKEVRDEVVAAIAPKVISQKKQLNPDQQLKIIQSDEDLNDPIDIRDTQVSKATALAKEAARTRIRNGSLEIIRGDETVADRLASLKGKNDIASIAERVRLSSSGSARMAVVKDDSLGAGFGSKSNVSMNAGQRLPSREEADAKKGNASAQAESRKKEAEMLRRAAGTVNVEGNAEEQATALDASHGAVEAVAVAAVETVSATSGLRAENAKLKAENDDMSARLSRLEKAMTAQAGAVPRRPGRPPKAVVAQ